MRAKSLFLVSVILSTSALASTDVQIIEVGLKGYYSTTSPTAVAVRVKVPASVNSLVLDFTVSLDARDKLAPSRVDRFSQRADVKPGQENQIVTPLLLSTSGTGHSTLEVDVSNAGGQRIGSSTVDLDSFTRIATETLIVIYCADRSICDEAQSQISFSGSEDDVSEKERKFKFVTVQSPRQSWLDYAAARFVVLAGPVASWTADQRFALEAYARRGGNLLMLEQQCTSINFLAPYRVGVARGPIVIGKGKLYRIASLQNKELGSIFAGKNLKKDDVTELVGNSTVDSVRRTFALSFDFPRLRWFLIWLASYIAIVGPANFALLHRLRRLEWGWATTTALALLFAIGLYFASSSHRPKKVTLDNVVIYWMDNKSPDAWGSMGIRVSSPERQKLELSVEDAVLTTARPVNTNQPSVNIATDITREQRFQPGWRAQLGSPFKVGLSLLRWSFTDLDFQTFHTFSGTVTMDRNLHIKNGTGQEFKEAMYLDFPNNRKYLIPGLRPGQEVDLNSVSWSPIWIRVRRSSGAYTFETNEAPPDGSPVPKGGFHLKDLPYSGFQFGGLSRVFVGRSDGPTPPANIAGMQIAQNQLVLMVVAMDQP